jgi:hypothetical protein
MKYYNIEITNLGMGWFKWMPMYRKMNKLYFWWLNWRIAFEYKEESK